MARGFDPQEFGKMMAKLENIANDVGDIKELLQIQNGRIRKAEEKIAQTDEWKKLATFVAASIGAPMIIAILAEIILK